MATRRYPYKDAPPSTTVRRIERILRRAKIATRRKPMLNNADVLFSQRITIEGFRYGTNGKGVTSQYALASAYAELMERLQNQWLYPYVEFNPTIHRHHGFTVDAHERIYRGSDIPVLPDDFRDAAIYGPYRSVAELWEAARDVLIRKDRPEVFVPFFDLRNDRVAYLPRTLVNVYGSNGMAAGNTPQEAIAQALAEVLERYVMKRVYFEEITPPTVPRDVVERYAPTQYKIIRRLEHVGKYRIVVKDCSLGSRLPVVAIILLRRGRDSYKVKFGASPVWQVALERCLTEAFQGRRIEPYPDAQPLNLAEVGWEKMDYDNYSEYLAAGSGQFPPAIFDDESDYPFTGFPDVAFGSQGEMMGHLVTLIGGLGHNIYARDVSFLGFNAYRVIVPGMSEALPVSNTEWKDIVTPFSVMGYLRDLDELSEAELRELTEDVENFMRAEAGREGADFSDYAGMPVEPYSPWRKVKLALFLALLHWKLGHAGKAHEHMTAHAALLRNGEDGVEDEVFFAARDLVGLAQRSPSSAEKIQRILSSVYAERTVRRALDIFAEGESVTRMVKEFYPDFELPGCWNCEECANNWHCRYRKIEAIHMSVKDAIKRRPIDQVSLREILVS